MSSTTRTVSDTLQDFWDTMPVRPRQSRKAGGVAAAIGQRYGIDPVLARVAFAVGVVYGGAGIVLYLVGWLLFPGETDAGTSRTERPAAGRTALLLVLLLLVVPWMHWPGWFGLALGIGGVVLLHHFRGGPGVPVQPEPPLRPGPPTGPGTETTTTDTVVTNTINTGTVIGDENPTEENTVDESTTAPTEEESASWEWSPPAPAPLTWGLSDPPPPAPEPPAAPLRRWVTPVALAAAVVAGAFAFVVTSSFTATLVTALSVLGFSMLVGSFLRGGRALIWFTIPLALLALAVDVAPRVPFTGAHDVTESPSTAADVSPQYETPVGTVSLRLDDLHLTPGQQIHTNVEVGVGKILVYVPSDVDVTGECSSNVGSVRCLGDEQRGTNIHDSIEGSGSNGHLFLDLTTGVGDVEVIRA